MTRRPRVWAALLAGLMMVLGLQALPAAGQPKAEGGRAAAQVLTWTAGNDIDKYLSAPATAVAGKLGSPLRSASGRSARHPACVARGRHPAAVRSVRY